ncbi:holin [Uliginosibacterium sp. 31-16]|uniref:holin n=1 Tax=Uliginosibacterium sp. 31-16 TaxID=3068315 RepID=UPI00273F0DF3|nr:holin [Uliginosibacterium sp. 31-16]MDP5239937.1 holin [Uliginosibacterium sp. 31-16]
MSKEFAIYTATFGGSMSAIWGWLTVTEWCAVGGFLVGAIGLCVQAWFTKRKNDREAAESKLRIDLLIKQINDV